MAMEPIDYSKAVTKIKDQYRSKANELKENLKNEVDTLEKSHEQSQAKKAETFTKAREKLDKDYETNLNTVRDISQEDLKEQKQRFTEELEKEKLAFNKDRRALKSDFDQRLKTINDSYNRSMDNFQTKSRLSTENAENNFKNKLENQKVAHESELRKINEDTLSKQADTLKDIRQRKIDLTNSHQSSMEKLQNDHIEREFKKDMDRKNSLNAMKNMHATEMEINERNAERTKKNLQETAQDQIQDLVKNQERLADQARKAQLAQRDKTLREHKKQVEDITRRAEIEKNDMKRLVKSYQAKSGEKEGVSESINNAIESDFRMKLKRKDDKVQELKDKFLRDNEEAQEAFRVGLEDQKVEQAKALNRKDQELNNFVTTSGLQHSLEKGELIENYNKRARNQEIVSQQALDSLDKASKRKLETHKQHFAETLERMSDDHQLMMETTKARLNQEKKDLLKKAEKEQADIAKNVSVNYQRKMDEQADTYEHRLEEVTDQKVTQEKELKGRLSKMQKARAMDLDYQQKLDEDRRMEDIKALKQSMELQEAEFALEKKELQRKSREGLKKVTTSYESKIERLIDNYELQIREMRAEFNRKLMAKTSEGNNTQKLMKQSFEVEKARMESQHANELASLRHSLETEISRLKRTQEATRASQAQYEEA